MTEKTKIVKCKVIPLFEYEIYYNEEEKDCSNYSFILVSDNLADLQDLIADRELEWSMKDCRKYLMITDFLYMPCKDSLKGYRLSNIDDSDIAGHGAGTQEAYVRCKFFGKIPQPVNLELVHEAYQKIKATLHPGEDNDCMIRPDLEYILADAIYRDANTQAKILAKKIAREHTEGMERIAGRDAIAILSRTVSE